MNKRMLTILFGACLIASPVQSGPADDIASLEVLPGWQTDAGTYMAGLRIDLAPGWKTYWRAPGSAGIPPQFSWAGSTNITSSSVHWPVPEVFDQDGQRSIGYHDSVVIPIELQTSTTGAPVRMKGEINIGVCDEICVPVRLMFDAILPTDGSRNPAIIAALVNRPMTAAEANVGAVTCAITPISDGLQVTTSITVPNAGHEEVVIIEAGNPQVWVSEPTVNRTGTTLIATADMVHVSGNAFALDRSAVRITVLGSDQAIDIQGCSAG